MGLLSVGVVVVSGCVPYQRYNTAVEELNQAKRLNDDLVRKYNQLLLETKNRPAGAAADPAQAERIAQLLQRNQDLERQLSDLNLRFEKSDEDFLEGGAQINEKGELVLTSDLLFDSGVEKLKKSHLPTLDSVINLIKTRYPGETIIIEGHTDDEPLKSIKHLFEHNWNLGYARARSVFDYFRNTHSFPKQQMVLMTYGYLRPVVSGTSEEARRQNRRVVIRRGGISKVGGPLAASR